MTDYNTALIKLKSYGELVGQFNQASYAEALLEKKNVKGYCVGVCIDWMRRILQGAKGSLLPEKDRRPRLTQTAARGFEAFTVTGSLLKESKATFADRNDVQLIKSKPWRLSRVWLNSVGCCRLKVLFCLRLIQSQLRNLRKLRLFCNRPEKQVSRQEL
jgi:hypothetical protein